MNEGDPIRPILVLGVGNILLHDEGLGVRAAEAMMEMDLGDDVDVVDGGTAGAALTDVIADRRKVVILDAIDAGGTPGTLYRFGIDDLASVEGEALSLHEIGLLEAFVMASRLKCRPESAIIVGMQPAEVGAGVDLSPTVREALPRMIERAKAELRP